ncbi:DUF6708 domain-containing protein, partial [Pseudomonas sp. IT-P74]|uniref:DUF6708 domain-containing protein n=1 Tax=Pseudomonas sp. IT-P74 TaxID=3026445 RepID=UPI0039E1D93D
MYFFEWLMHNGRATTDYEALAREADQQIANKEKLPPIRVTQPVFQSISDNESLYNYNSTYIDVRTPNDEKRGMITLIAGGAGSMLLAMLCILLPYIGEEYLYLLNGKGIRWKTIEYLFMWTIPIMSLASVYFYIKHVFPYLRLEAFTARRLIVRFNRVTRKIYLLRPKHLGGIVALDWDTAEVCINPKMSELDGTGGFVMLGWDKETHSVRDADGHLKDDFEITFVGKPTRNASELLAFWEYIRRYMEEG